ncbi:MAG TPA: hypothetical protein VEJ43_00770 [Pseudolabrys sp.]|nr:hypothetical protein [Pseudolabrys sp.]
MPVSDSVAASLMLEFGSRTGLTSAIEHPRRYLWTDAFAVCNFLELFARTGEQKYQEYALLLIDQVHRMLGRYREDDVRRGWISGLDEENGRLHPTIGGLRIGKPLKEREYTEPFDEGLEWDRDGQYFHYLTKWMHALSQTAIIANRPTYARWAGELASAAFQGFAFASSGRLLGIYWKMSTDLSRPLVAAMGLHDVVDGLITFREVAKAITSGSIADGMINIVTAIKSLSALCQRRDLVTDDPLGLGGLLFDACRLCELLDPKSHADVELFETLLDGCSHGLNRFVRARPLAEPASNRLAFRELGLAIGLKAVPSIRHRITEHGTHFENRTNLRRAINLIETHASMSDEIIGAWLPHAEDQDKNWRRHQDINEVMLSTALVPNTFLSTFGREAIALLGVKRA